MANDALVKAVLEHAAELPHWYVNNDDLTQHHVECPGCRLVALASGTTQTPIMEGWACAWHGDPTKPHGECCTSWQYRTKVRHGE